MNIIQIIPHLKTFVEGDAVVVKSNDGTFIAHGKVDMAYDDELGRLDVIDCTDNSMFMISAHPSSLEIHKE
jgi:hypothetical protein